MTVRFLFWLTEICSVYKLYGLVVKSGIAGDAESGAPIKTSDESCTEKRELLAVATSLSDGSTHWAPAQQY